MKCHDGAQRFRDVAVQFSPGFYTQGDGTRHEFKRDLCDYCGSLTIDDAIKAFQTPGVHWSGSDWKYGWPHKLYIEIPCEPYQKVVCSKSEPGKPTGHEYGESRIEHFKFYTEHLIDATPQQIEQWNAIVQPICGIRFVIGSDGELRYSAPRPGHQGYGVIGEPAPAPVSE